MPIASIQDHSMLLNRVGAGQDRYDESQAQKASGKGEVKAELLKIEFEKTTERVAAHKLARQISS